MKKSTKKIVSTALSAMMLMGCVSTGFSVSASTGELCSKYATNPNGQVGKAKTITVDGDASDWSEDMLIAQGAAWDVANHYKGGHENCVLDTYSLYATWDNDNLYVGWQMVNTTDTWAREGDGPLSDGGRVLDVPLILALSVDENSTSMSNKNTDGGPIWGQKMGLEFNQHVDHLFYMSGKPGLGTPAMFTAVDSEGNTDYTTGCTTFASAGIEYKMATTNICSSIWGLNYSEDTSDVYDDNADWVDYKTFEGTSGTHDTKYDSFYEMKIPFSALGIDKTYLEQNGVGAMLVATRGESGLDCIPYDDTMLDNATGDYSSDPSTSAEKDDVDVITSKFARIGNMGGEPVTTPTAQPTTAQPTTVQPTTSAATTVAPTTAQPATDLTVTATSNLFPEKTVTVDKNAKTVTVNCDLQSTMKIVNGYVEISYDPNVLSFDAEKNADILPFISNETTNAQEGIIRTVFSDVNDLYDFTTNKSFLNIVFDVVSTGSTTVDVYVDELSVGYHSGNTLNFKNAYTGGEAVDLSSVSGFTTSKLTGSTTIFADQAPTTAPATTVPATTQPSTTQPATSATQPTTTPSVDVPTDGYYVYGDNIKLKLTSCGTNKVSGTMALQRGTYKFKLDNYGTLLGYTKTITDSTTGLTFNKKYSGSVTLNATGGTYTFQVNTNTNTLVVKYNNNLPNDYLIGDLNTILTPVSGKTLAIGSTYLSAGTYKFKLSSGATEYGYNKVVNNTTNGSSLSFNSKYSSYVILNATGGTYTFTLNTSTKKLIVGYVPAKDEKTDDVHVSGDIDLVLNDNGGESNVATGSVKLDEGTYSFKIYNYGTAYTAGAKIVDNGTKALKSSYTANVTLVASGGTYTFSFNKTTGSLTVTKK